MGDFKSFFKSYKKNNSNILTHTTFGDKFSSGSYSIPESEYDKIYNYIIYKYNKTKYIPLVERIPYNKIKHFMIDLDLHYNTICNPTNDELNLFCKLFIQTIKNYTNYSNNTCTIYIQQRSSGYFCEKTKIYKSGVHLIVPDFVSDTETQHFIRNKMIQIMNRNILINTNNDDKLINNDDKLLTNDTYIIDDINDVIFKNVIISNEDIFDKSVISSNGFFVYGCGKQGQKSVYLVSHIFKYDIINNIYLFEPFKMDVNIENIKFLSQRKDYSGYTICSLKDKYTTPNIIIPSESVNTIKTYIKVFNNKKLSNAESAEYYYLLQNISSKRYDNYLDWFKILLILKNANIAFDVFDEFSSKSYKYKGSIFCLDEWNSVNIKDVNNKLSISTLYEWFKRDNETYFYYFQNLIDNVINISSHSCIADLYIEIVKKNNNMNKYIYNPSHNQWYYITHNNIWVASGKSADPDLLKHDIKNVLFFLFQRKLEYIKTLIFINKEKIKNINNTISKDTNNETNTDLLNNFNDINNKINTLDKNHKQILKILKQVGTSSESRAIIDYLRYYLTNETITLESFNLPHIFSCKNMLFDSSIINNNIIGWRNIRPEDMVMHTTGYDYHLEPLIEQQTYIIKFIESLFESKDISNFLLHNIALSLNGSLEGRQFFNIFTGNSRNGKSLLFNFLLRTFGQYGYSMSSDLFTCASKDPNKANIVLFGLIGIRLAIVSELEDNAVIYTKLIKSLTGADEQNARTLFGKIISFIPQCFLGLLCNALPKFYDSSEAMNTRNKVIKFPFTFGDIDDGKFKKIADNNLDINLRDEKMYIAMLQILSNLYISNYKKNKNKLDIPLSILNDTRDYNIENDDVHTWFTNFYDIGITDEKIMFSTLYNQFKIDTEIYNISDKVFRNCLKNKFNIQTKRESRGAVYTNIKRKNSL